MADSRGASEREKVENALRESEERFRATFEQAAVGMSHTAPDGRLLRVNRRLCDILGYAREELVGMKIQERTHTDYLDKDLEQARQLLAGEIATYSMEKRLFRKDESVVWVNLTISLVRDPSGEPDYFIAVCEDITERKRAEEALRESNRRTENILESITDAFFTVDRDWRCTYVNSAAEELSAKSREELIGKNMWEEFPQMADLKFYPEYHRAMDEGVTVQFEEYYPSPLEKWVDIKAYPSEEGLSVYARDITERKKLEAEQQRLVGIVRNSSDFIGICDLDWQVTYVNEAGQSLVGLNGMEEVRRTTVLDYFAPEDRAFVQNEVMPTAMEKGRWAGERELGLRHFETGEKIPVIWDIFRIDDPRTGEPISLATVTRDITERKRAEERLQESNRRTEDILESITDAFYAVDREWRLTYINERALRRVQRIKGEEIAREEIVGRNIWELYPETVGSVLYDKYHEAMREHKTVEFEAYSTVSDRWLEVHVYPSEEGLSIYSRDVTERKRDEEQLAYYTRLRENMHDAFIATDEQLLVKAWNKGAEKMYGWTTGEALGRDAREVVSLDMSDEQLAEALREIERKGRWRVEQIQHHKDGTPFHIDSLTIAMRSERGKTTGYLAINRDITERKRVEEALQESNRRIENILESITENFFSVDREWRFTYINERALGTMQSIRGEGLTREGLLGKNVWEVLPEHVGSTFYHKYHEAMREQKTVEFEEYSPLSGRWIEAHAYPSEEGLSVYDQDITERKQAEERLQEANRRLEDLAVLKADFTAMVAHELDTPLAVISGYAALLAAGKLEPSARSQALARIQSETGVLKALVSDVRAAATVEREYFGIEPRNVPVGVLLQRAAEFAATLPGDHPLTVENAVEEERVVRADPDRIGQVLRNLLSNAAKYSPHGAPIELRAKPVEAGVRIEVADRGSGIHPDDASRVFEKFGRGRDLSGRKVAGAGLGLYLSRRIVLAHGGDLTLETAPGGGSVFGFELEPAR